MSNEISQTEPAATVDAQTNSSPGWVRAFVLLALTATTIVAPMFFLGAASGHDFQFHIASWIDVAGQWREGIFFPRWAEWANWGYGEPRFIFYPPASWMLGAALGSVLPWAAAPVVYIWLALLAGGMFMWKLAREWLSPAEAAAAAVFFAANPYSLLVVYYRSDFAELLAGAFFPLLVLAVFRVIRDGWPRVPFLAVVFGVIWLCNAPAAVIATYSVAFLLAVGSALNQTLRPLLTGGVGMAGGFGVTAFYILPAAWEQRWVQITQTVSSNLRIEQNFIFTKATEPEFLLFNWKVSTLALGVMLVAGVLAVFVARRRRDFSQLWCMLLALGMVSALLMFSATAPLWHLLPKLRFVQFPWRWLNSLVVVFAFFSAAAFGAARKVANRRQRAVWAIIILMLGATAIAIAMQTWWNSDDATDIAEWVRSGDGYEGTDEYLPIGCDRYDLPGVSPDAEQPPTNPVAALARFDTTSGTVVPAAGIRLHVEKWTAERKIVSEESQSAVRLAFRLLGYPAWDALVDGQRVPITSARKGGEMLLALPSGAHRVDLHFRRTWDRGVGDLISLVSAVVLVVCANPRRLISKA